MARNKGSPGKNSISEQPEAFPVWTNQCSAALCFNLTGNCSMHEQGDGRAAIQPRAHRDVQTVTGLALARFEHRSRRNQ